MKNIFKIALVTIILFTLCGCSNDDNYANYEHYDLYGKEMITHMFVDNNGKHTYAVANITPDPYETNVYGLFYQISANDFILLNKIESPNDLKSANKFLDNKLYVLDNSSDGFYLEYTLDEEKITEKKLDWNYYKGFVAHGIKDIDYNYIYYSAVTNEDTEDGSVGHTISIELKCSLKTYECELNE